MPYSKRYYHYNNKKNYNDDRKEQILTTYQKDQIMGERAEQEFVQIVKNKYDIDVLRTKKYCFADFICIDKKIIFELKRRNLNKNKFPITVMPYDKITRFNEYNMENGGNYLFIMVFQFNDGMWFLEHNIRNKYNIGPYVRKPRSGFVDKPKDHLFIQVKDLEPMDNIKRYTDSKKMIVRYSV